MSNQGRDFLAVADSLVRTSRVLRSSHVRIGDLEVVAQEREWCPGWTATVFGAVGGGIGDDVNLGRGNGPDELMAIAAALLDARRRAERVGRALSTPEGVRFLGGAK